MKNFKLIIIALSTALIFVSCKNDDGQTLAIHYGTFEYDGTTYQFRSGYGENYGQDTTLSQATNIDLLLFSDGLNLVFNQGVRDSIYGTGISIFLESYSANSQSFSEGVYTFDDSGLYPANSFTSRSDISVGNFTTSELDFIEIIGGNYTVVGDDNTYTITFELLLMNGKTLTGTYSGIIPIR